jgi:hypothetical protein
MAPISRCGRLAGEQCAKRPYDLPRLVCDLPIAESLDLVAQQSQLGVADAVVDEGLAAVVRVVAVGLDDDALRAPEEVDREGLDSDVDLGASEVVATAEPEEVALEVASGVVGGLGGVQR